MTRVPPVTALLLLACAAAWCLPGADAVLVYDRGAILRGDGWRLFTGHFVHYASSHLWWNVGVLALAGGAAEWRCALAWRTAMGVTVVATGPLLWLLQPGLAVVAGASGLATAAVAVLATEAATAGGAARWVGVAALCVVVLKVAVESVWGVALFAAGDFVPVPLAHLVGLVAAGVGVSYDRADRTAWWLNQSS